MCLASGRIISLMVINQNYYQLSNIGLYLWSAILLLQASAIAAPEELISETGFSGGLVVHVGAADTKLVQQLVAGNKNSVVQVLLKDNVAKTRKELHEQKLLGRVFADSWDGSHLPQVDASVNLMIVESPIEMREIQRALAPGGTALIKNKSEWEEVTQPRPKEIDDWTHYLYDPSNNPVSKDTKVAPPKHMQWWAPPLYSRTHEIESSVPVVVTAGGKIVYIVDEGLTGIIDKRLPETWMLVGRDAFSGVQLWKRPLTNWGWPEWRPERAKRPFNVQDYSESKPPVTLPRRLVMNDIHAFVTLGWTARVSMLDVATGKTVATFDGTEGTEEILLRDGILYLAVSTEPGNRKSNRFVLTLDTTTKAVLWKSKTYNIQNEMFAVQGEHLYFQTQTDLHCLNRNTGEIKWKFSVKADNSGYFGAKDGLLATERAVYITGRTWKPRSTKLLAIDPQSGKLLWEKSKGFVSSAGGNPANVFEIDGVAWGALGAKSDFTGLDARTGKVIKTLDPKDTISQHHHIRCFRGKATSNYLLWPYRGTEFLDLAGDKHSRHD